MPHLNSYFFDAKFPDTPDSFGSFVRPQSKSARDSTSRNRSAKEWQITRVYYVDRERSHLTFFSTKILKCKLMLDHRFVINYIIRPPQFFFLHVMPNSAQRYVRWYGGLRHRKISPNRFNRAHDCFAIRRCIANDCHEE